MFIRRFIAPTVPEALEAVKRELGDEALVVETRAHERGVLVTAMKERPGLGTSTAPLPSAPPSPPLEGLSDLLSSLAGADGAAPWEEIREEIRALRREMARLYPGTTERDLDGPSAALYEELRGRGAAPELAARVTRAAVDGGDPEPGELRARARDILAGLGDAVSGRETTGEAGVLILAGAPGAGKTTTAAKIAALQTIVQHRSVLLVSADRHRLGGPDPLLELGRNLDVPVEVLDEPGRIGEIVAAHPGVDSVVVDTAGVPRGDRRRLGEVERLRAACPDSRLELLLPADADRASLSAVMDRFRSLGPDQVALTRIDEAVRPAGALSVLLESRLPAAHLSTGPDVPDDLEIPTALRLAALAIPRGGPAEAREGDPR